LRAFTREEAEEAGFFDAQVCNEGLQGEMFEEFLERQNSGSAEDKKPSGAKPTKSKSSRKKL
jgi:hypothetical protein